MARQYAVEQFSQNECQEDTMADRMAIRMNVMAGDGWEVAHITGLYAPSLYSDGEPTDDPIQIIYVTFVKTTAAPPVLLLRGIDSPLVQEAVTVL